jgi:hypothetical protein
MIRRYIAWRNRNTRDRRLSEIVNRANVACCGTDMKRPVKAMVPLVDGMVEPQRGLHAEAHEHAYGVSSRAGGGDRAARGVARRAGTQWIGWPPH